MNSYGSIMIYFLLQKEKKNCTKEDLHDKSFPKQTDWTLDMLPDPTK